MKVDGAADEGPSHDEVNSYWAARHLEHGKLATLVNSRSSGSSFLNRAKLQNGFLALGHTNPTTLNGSAFSPEMGVIDKERLKANLELATDLYIERVNGSPCGETVISLDKGAESSLLQRKRKYLLCS